MTLAISSLGLKVSDCKKLSRVDVPELQVFHFVSAELNSEKRREKGEVDM